MGKCLKCGNEYDRSFDVIMDGTTYTFDSFECAIEELAPRCAHCDCKIIGHGVQSENSIYCCASCARHDGEDELKDRV